MLFNHTKQDKMQIFEGILFFTATNNTKKQTYNLAATSWVPPEHILLDAHILLEEPNWQQLFVCFWTQLAATILFVLFVAL